MSNRPEITQQELNQLTIGLQGVLKTEKRNTLHVKKLVEYLIENPEEAKRLWYLRYGNPKVFRATAKELLPAFCKHPKDSFETLAAAVGIGVAFAFLFLYGFSFRFSGVANTSRQAPTINDAIQIRFGQSTTRPTGG